MKKYEYRGKQYSRLEDIDIPYSQALEWVKTGKVCIIQEEKTEEPTFQAHRSPKKEKEGLTSSKPKKSS